MPIGPSAYLPTVVPDVAYALLWLWIINPLYGPLNLALDAVGGPTPRWLTDPRAAQWAVIIMSLFVIGEGFIVAMATRQGIPGELYELGDVEDATPLYMFWRVTLPLMAPTLLLLMFRDTIFSFQANFVPALLVTGGGPPPYATTYLPLFIYRNAFEYLRYGYASAATLVMFGLTALIVYVQWRIVSAGATLLSSGDDPPEAGFRRRKARFALASSPINPPRVSANSLPLGLPPGKARLRPAVRRPGRPVGGFQVRRAVVWRHERTERHRRLRTGVE